MKRLIPLLFLLAAFGFGCAPSGKIQLLPFERCETGNLLPYGCELRTYSLPRTSTPGITWATGAGWTREPPTYIQVHLVLERKQADGSWVALWTETSGATGQEHDMHSATIQCEHGRYRWFMQVTFASKQRTIFQEIGQEMAL